MKFRLVLMLIIGFAWEIIHAQTDFNVIPKVTDVILINDVFIMDDPAKAGQLYDVLIEKGLITQLAHKIETPYNAKLIEGDSAFLYPSFIDGLSYIGAKAEKKSSERPKVKFPGHPPNEVVGILPNRSAVEHFNSDDGMISDFRKHGFAISHAVARGNMLPGQGSVVLLNDSQDKTNILEKDVSQYFQFKGVRGFYPSTVIGIIAKWKDLLMQTKYYQEHQKQFESDLEGVTKMAHNDVYESLMPVLNKQKKVFMHTQKIKSVYQALTLEREFGYDLVLADIKQGWDAIEKIKSRNIQVLLSLDLPKEEDKKSNENITDSLEYKALVNRKNNSIKAYQEQAFRFAKAEIPFAFCMLSAKPGDVKKNLNTLVKTGVDKYEIIKALTVNAADILGISDYAGNIEKGKMANVFLSDKEYFEKDAHISWHIIGGQHYEFPKNKKSKNKKGVDAYSDIIGDWSFSVTVEGETTTGNFNISDGPKVTVTDDDEPGVSTEASNVSFNESELKFDLIVTDEGISFPVSLTLSFTIDSFDGTAEIEGLGNYVITGEKISSPE